MVYYIANTQTSKVEVLLRNPINKPLAAFATLAAGLSLSGCDFEINVDSGDGVPLSELEINGAAPDSLALAAPDTVIITEGDTLEITIDGSEEAQEDLRFELDGDDLEIYRDGSWDGNDYATINVTMPIPRDLAIGGSGTIETPSMADNAAIAIGGSGSVSIAQLDSNSLDVAIGGSGDVTAAGTTDRLDIAVGGSGDVQFAGVTADDVEIAIGGSGSVALASNGSVDASIAGSGDITVTGTATCTVSAVGSGTLTCRPAAEEEVTSEDVDTEEAASDDNE